MKIIKLIAKEHRGKKCVFLFFENDIELVTILRNAFPKLTWSDTHKTWYLDHYNQILSDFFRHFKGKLFIDYSDFKREKNIEVVSVRERLEELSELQLNYIQRFKNYLSAKRYSDNTVKAYSEAISTFLKFYAQKSITEIENKDIERFNIEYILKNKLSASYQNQVVNAIKLFFMIVHEKKMVVDLIQRPRMEHKLPNVLSKEEVKAILEALVNSKHKAMLSLIYACGLRRSELLNLKLKDVQSDRKILLIKQSKGKKDRIVPISDKIIEMLRSYYLEYRPKMYLFEGQDPSKRYGERSLELILKKSITIAKIDKPVTLHWLRHSYATHLMESGTDLRYIQELLGHNSSRTTEIYTHVSTKSIQQIKSPFDYL